MKAFPTKPSGTDIIVLTRLPSTGLLVSLPVCGWVALLVTSFSAGAACFHQQVNAAQRAVYQGPQQGESADLRRREAELRRELRVSPDNPRTWASLGNLLAIEQRMEEAKQCFERALGHNPGNSDIREKLAVSQWQTGEPEKAKENLEFNLKSKPHDAPTILLLGMVVESLKEYEYASKLLESVSGEVLQQPQPMVVLARAYYRTERPAKARDVLNHLVEHSEAVSEVFMAGRLALEAQDHEIAERLFASIRSTYPDGVALGYNLALVQYRSDRFQPCQETLLSVISTGHADGDCYNLLGWCCQKQNKQEETIHAFEKAIELEPSKEANYLDLAMILANSQDLSPASQAAQRGLEKIPTSYRLNMMKGMIAFKQRHLDEAVESYLRAVALNPESPEANYSLASAQLSSGLVKDAMLTFEKGITRFPRDPLHFQGYAALLLDHAPLSDAKVHAHIVSLLERAIALDGSRPEPYYLLGKLWMKEGNNERALPHLETAVQRDPNSSKIHFALSGIYRSLGRKADASNELQVFQKLKAREAQETNATSSISTQP